MTRRIHVYQHNSDGSAKWLGFFTPSESLHWDEPRDIDKNGAKVGRISQKPNSRSRLWATGLQEPFEWVLQTWRLSDGHITTGDRCKFITACEAGNWFQDADMLHFLQKSDPVTFNRLFGAKEDAESSV